VIYLLKDRLLKYPFVGNKNFKFQLCSNIVWVLQNSVNIYVIDFDLDYMQGSIVFTWSAKGCSNSKKLINDLAIDGFKTVTIIHPGVNYEANPNYQVFDQGIDKDYFVRKADTEL